MPGCPGLLPGSVRDQLDQLHEAPEQLDKLTVGKYRQILPAAITGADTCKYNL